MVGLFLVLSSCLTCIGRRCFLYLFLFRVFLLAHGGGGWLGSSTGWLLSRVFGKERRGDVAGLNTVGASFAVVVIVGGDDGGGGGPWALVLRVCACLIACLDSNIVRRDLI